MPTAAPTSVDEREYAQLVEPFRGELHAHCCRMLKSSEDAEDALQEALLRAWRGLPSFEGRSSLRAWLYRISTNACLDSIERRKPVVPLDGGAPFDARLADGPLGVEPLDDGPTPEAGYERREELERALAAAFDHLSPRARTVFVLRTALGYKAREVAALLGTSVASVNSALQRARATLGEVRLEGTTDVLSDARIPRCAVALQQGDLATAIRLLTQE